MDTKQAAALGRVFAVTAEQAGSLDASAQVAEAIGCVAAAREFREALRAVERAGLNLHAEMANLAGSINAAATDAAVERFRLAGVL